MVKGLDLFRAHFSAYADRYVLIGGTASSVVMEEAGLEFRATKDLDVVLCVEALDAAFVTAFWEFIKVGGYQNQQRSTDKKLFYRFHSPKDNRYPEMIELFSRTPDNFQLADDSHLTPLPMDEEISSLSAILLDGDYYTLIHSGKLQIGGLSIIGAEYLIPLKMRAWLDLSQRREAGEPIDDKNIRKHRNDVMRLYQLLSPTMRIALPDTVKEDAQRFLDRISEDKTIDLKNLGIKNTGLSSIVEMIRVIY